MEIGPFLVRLLPVLSALAVASIVEWFVPLRQQSRRSNGRLATNLWLLAITLALGIVLNLALALGAAYFAQRGIGLLQAFGVSGAAAFIAALLALDGASYLAHRVMHQTPTLWRVHLVHHIDSSVDATSAFRQHPIEGVLRFSFIAITAWSLGAPLAAIAVYRLLGSLNSVLEHSNIRLPRWVDRVLVWIWVTPDMHKVHHSREPSETDSNYANLFSFFDRLFGTFTPSSRGPLVRYGIHGFDAPKQHSIGAVLWLPFRGLDLPAAVVTAMPEAAGESNDRRSQA